MTTFDIIFVIASILTLLALPTFLILDSIREKQKTKTKTPKLARFKPDGITDNRMEWAKKVLRQQVPECEMFLAVQVLRWRATREDSAFNPTPYESQIQPRLIAKNWNK